MVVNTNASVKCDDSILKFYIGKLLIIENLNLKLEGYIQKLINYKIEF